MQIKRRQFLRASGTIALLPIDNSPSDRAKDISGIAPSLAFTLTDAATGRRVTEADFRGSLALLYFGYTFCPDVCPAALTNLVDVLDRLGPLAGQVRVLFVTVDPQRDTIPVLHHYVSLFSPRILGLRGTADQLAILARRYRVLYSVSMAQHGQTIEVSHSAAVFVFDRSAAARLLEPTMSSSRPDIAGMVADLRRLLAEPAAIGNVSDRLGREPGTAW